MTALSQLQSKSLGQAATVVYLFRKQGYKLCKVILQKFRGKNLKSMGWPFLICLAKKIQHIIFYAHVHTCRPSHTDEE